MKRIIALILCIGIFAASAAGCAGAGQQTEATGDEAVNMNVEAYKNTYDDLLTYLSAWGYINPLKENEGKTYNVMTAELIGAKRGKRFVAQHTKDTTIEIYEYDLEKELNATADEVVTSVEKTNTFKNFFDETVENVYMSKKNKYMMIYTDKTINGDTKETDDNYVKRKEVIEKFVAFDR